MDASRRVWRAAGLAPFVVLLTVSSALAQVSRTFVASYGNDADNCSLTLPCRGFAAALAKTQDKGEVVVLDSAGYGPATISQSVSIVAPASVYAGITVSSGVGIAINGSHPRVVLRNVVINGLGGGRGVQVQQPAEVHVYDCEISNLATGIEVTAAGAGSTLYVRGAVVRGSGTAVHVGGKSTFQIEGSRLLENGSGVLVDGGGLGSIRHTVIAGGTVRGVELNSSTALGGIALTIEDSLIADHTFDGVMASVAPSSDSIRVDIARTTLTRNFHGASALAASPSSTAVISVNDSTISQNHADGLYADGAAATIVSNANTFSLNIGHALNASAGSTILTAKGADGLPNNAGEQASPTSGTVTPLSAF